MEIIWIYYGFSDAIHCFFENQSSLALEIIVCRKSYYNENPVYNKTVIGWDFCDYIKVSVSIIALTSTLTILDITKTTWHIQQLFIINCMYSTSGVLSSMT